MITLRLISTSARKVEIGQLPPFDVVTQRRRESVLPPVLPTDSTSSLTSRHSLWTSRHISDDVSYLIARFCRVQFRL